MRDLLEEILEDGPIDPVRAARRGLRPGLRQRFFRDVTVGKEQGGFPILLDERPVRTPARGLLAVPTRELAAAIAAEWDAQRETIDPARMPLTRLANSIIDGVCAARGPVAAEIEKYLGADLIFYRAGQPDGLVSLQTRHWDPVLAWARDDLRAAFMTATGIMFVQQPEPVIAAVRATFPEDPWMLGAVHSITTLTGSALLALALQRGRLSAHEVWSAAHVDEDWNMAQWGQDELAMERRAFRWEEMKAAATVLETLG